MITTSPNTQVQALLREIYGDLPISTATTISINERQRQFILAALHQLDLQLLPPDHVLNVTGRCEHEQMCWVADGNPNPTLKDEADKLFDLINEAIPGGVVNGLYL